MPILARRVPNPPLRPPRPPPSSSPAPNPSAARSPLTLRSTARATGKIPFPLTPSFKGMLQRGINLSTLDTAYVTSMSWCLPTPRGAGRWPPARLPTPAPTPRRLRHARRYFLIMFGMRGLYSIVLGAGAETDDARMMQAQMGMGAQGQPGQAPDMNKIFSAEAENLQIVEHVWFLDGAEERLLRASSGTSKGRAKTD